MGGLPYEFTQIILSIRGSLKYFVMQGELIMARTALVDVITKTQMFFLAL